ncbi:MAG: DUF4404 family protein [Porticoccaceae bacterium]
MDKALLAEIEALQQELNKAALGDDDLDLLSRVVEDVTTLTSEGAADQGAEHHALRERLRQVATRFEVSHPRLAGAVERLANTLSSLGI